MTELAPTSISRARTPDLIPGYRLMELLGKGGMGEVHKAQQLSLGRPVAIKLLASNLSSDPAFVARFEKEAAALAALSHPHIVSIVDKGKTDSTYYLVMEYVQGPSLRDLMRSADFDLAQALRVIVDVCRAIDYAHHRGIIHRDLKPENILIDEQAGRIAKVSDFGLAGFLEGDAAARFSVTSTHVAMGTAAYMAPEQRVDAKNADNRADLYALGVMLYEVLTGQLPLGSFAPPSELKPGVDKRLDAIVDRCLKTAPSERYATAGELLAALEPMAPASFTQPPKPLSTVERAGLAARRAARATARAAALGIVLLAAGVLVVTAVRNTTRPTGPQPLPGARLSAELVPLPPPELKGRVEERGLKRSVHVGEGPDTLPLLSAGRPVLVGEGGLRFGLAESAAPVGRAIVDLTEVEADGLTYSAQLWAAVPPSDWKGALRRALLGTTPEPRGALVLWGSPGRYVAVVLGPAGVPLTLEYALGERRGAMLGPPSPGTTTELELAIDLEGTLRAYAGTGVDRRPVGEPLQLGKEWRKAFGGLPRPATGCLEGACGFAKVRFLTEREPPPPPPPPKPEPEPVVAKPEPKGKGPVAGAKQARPVAQATPKKVVPAPAPKRPPAKIEAPKGPILGGKKKK